MPRSSDEMRIQVELPSPTNHFSPWDSRHINRLTKASLIQRDTSEFTRQRDSILVSVATANSNSLANADHDDLLSQKLLASQRNVRLMQHPHDSDVSLEDSDFDVDDERPKSPDGSLAGDCSEYDCHDPSRARGDCSLMGSHTTRSVDPDRSAVFPSLTRPTRIRFRSRVRITSGLSRHRRSINPSFAGTESRTNTLQSTNGDMNYFSFTPSSSMSGSPSSSISAPLRSRTDDEADRPGWGPLGQRVSMFAKKNRLKRKPRSSDDNRSWNKPIGVEGLAAPHQRINENSPLLRGTNPKKSAPRHDQQWQRQRACYCIDCRNPSRITPSLEEVDQAFGRWPIRLLNYQWWWWQTERVICCRCLDETDDDY